MALDVGERRVGVAVSDELGMIASPVEIVDLKRHGMERLRLTIDRYDPERIVIGLPTNMSGLEGAQAAAVREFAQQLADLTGRDITFWDERLTSFAAEQTLINLGDRRRNRRTRLDAVAAALILQSYLDSRKS